MDNYGTNFRSPKVDVHKFSMIPRSDVPRSTLRQQHQHKTTIQCTTLYPIYCQEVLPGDTFKGNLTIFARLQTPVYPIMDNMDIETFFFFVPNRIVWSHWTNFMGEQPSTPSDSISYTIPQIVSPANGFAQQSIYDYLGIPTAGQITVGNTVTINALPLRAYNLIWNQWFRDENLQNAQGFGATNTVFDFGDGPDPYTNYLLQNTAKRHDYFTSCLPWTQKGGVAITLPLGTSAQVKTSASATYTGVQNPILYNLTSGANPTAAQYYGSGPSGAGANMQYTGTSATGGAFTPTASNNVYPSNLYADLSTATAATINQLRLAFQTQALLEKDARGGTRYQELIMSHFGVHPLDARLQRPEYLGGGKTPLTMQPVPQTNGTGASGTTSPLGQLAGVGMARGGGHSFRASFTEHGHVIGLITVRNDKVYQQGLHRMWTRSTRYDFYWPVFALLGEQSVRNDEIYCIGGNTGQDQNTFGYQERWSEYRYYPSRTSSFMRSTNTTPLDAWHLAQKFTSLPALNAAFIQDDLSQTIARNLAGGSQGHEQIILDMFFDVVAARPLPMYSVPAQLGRF